MRIAIDPKDLAEHPLRVGLSMDVTIDTADLKGKALNDTPRKAPATLTSVFETQSQAADQRVAHIIAANMGRPAR